MPGAPEPSGRQLNQDEEQLLVWKIRTRKCLKKIHPQNGCPKSIFKPVESDQFQIGTHRRLSDKLHLQALTQYCSGPVRHTMEGCVESGCWGATEQNAELRILLQIQTPLKDGV